MLKQLTIQLRKRQLMDICGNPVSYTGANPLSLSPTIGAISNPWFDFTDSVEGLQDIELDWTADKTNEGRPVVGHYAPTKGVSGVISFEREAYEFIKAHLVQDVAAPLNQIDVLITDINCGKYIGYVIKADYLNWCEFNALCKFDISIKQVEDYTNCIERTVISDNWQGWFQNEPAGGKKHPRFSYCIEKRPNWTLVLLWQIGMIGALLLSVLYTIIYPLLLIVWLLQVALSAVVTAINFVIGVINSTIITAINALISIVGGTPISDIPLIPSYDPGPAPVTPVEVFLNWSTSLMETAGCGREHPAPLVRDYILNVCNKCGVQVSATTLDLFFAPLITLTHSDGAEHTTPNPYYNACYFFPQVRRGVRRYRQINIITGESDADTTTYYQPENAPVLSLAQFLDQLSKLYNQQWRIIVENDPITGTPAPFLYMKRADWFQQNQSPLYDFSFGGADRSKIVAGICYEQDEVKLYAVAGYLYEDDAADKCAAEASSSYNGIQHVTFGNTVINPIYHGIMEKDSGFASCRFNCDGITRNYLYDALQVCYSLAPITSGIMLPILNELGNKIEEFANYKVLLQTETVSKPRVLIWDGDTDNPSEPNYLNATAIRNKINIAGVVYDLGHTPIDGTVPVIGKPLINTRYLSQVPSAGSSYPCSVFIPTSVPEPVEWVDNHPVDSGTTGRFPVFASPAGVYTVTDIFGSTLIPAAAILVNYPQYYEPHYLNTLWDWFHWIDDPIRWPKLNKSWSVKIPLCCEDVQRLNLTENVNGQKLLFPVLLDTDFYNLGVLTSIKVSYQSGEDEGTGQTIELKGRV